MKSDKNGLASTRDLTRILIVLEEINKPVSKYWLSGKLSTTYKRLEDGLLWLINHKLVRVIKNTHGEKIYILSS